MALGLTYVLLGAPALGLQPWRAMLYLAGLAVCWGIAAQSLMLAIVR